LCLDDYTFTTSVKAEISERIICDVTNIHLCRHLLMVSFDFFPSLSLIDGVTHTTRVNRTAFSCAKINIIKVDFHYRKWGHGVVDCLRSSTSEQEFNTTSVTTYVRASIPTTSVKGLQQFDYNQVSHLLSFTASTYQ